MIYTAEQTKKISKDILRIILRIISKYMQWVVLVPKQRLVVSVWHAQCALHA
jgi:hypothetical protein